MTKIISLVENTSKSDYKTAHGLSLYIECDNHKILFDVGYDDTFIENAQRLGVDLSQVDTIVISHGHRDHGGALGLALSLNNSVRAYIQREAFAPHFSHRSTGVSEIGLDTALASHPRVVLLDGEYQIDEQLTLLKVSESSICPSGANATLYQGDSPDTFHHEQNLIIKGEEPILIMGCGHNGIVNIMRRAEEFAPKICIGGFHLTNPSARRDEPRELIDKIIEHLQHYPTTEFHTCHCTGVTVYQYMSSRISNIHYLACGESLELQE